ncbi:MAG: efflux RND transporter periplasmic adaptor subunit [Candidatus Cryptobacteroides sp.]
MRKEMRILPCLAALMLGITTLVGCGGRVSAIFNRESTPAERDPVAVKVLRTGPSEKSGESRYVGKVEASRSVVLNARFGGTLSSLKVVEGQMVKAGQPVAETVSESVRSSYEMAMATLNQAEDGYRRVKAVYDIGAVAEVKMVEMETQLAKARASANAARKTMEDCTLKAPYGGVVSDVYADEGVDLQLGAPVVRIMDVSSLEIVFSIPENEYSGVKVGDTAWVDVPAVSRQFAAKVCAKGFVASDLSHGYKVRLSVSEDVPGMMPGMVCKVSLTEKSGPAVTVVPAVAIRTDDSGRYVWVVRDGKVVRVSVVTGGFSGSGVVVSEGLSEGDLVVVEGMKNICSGMSVNVVE